MPRMAAVRGIFFVCYAFLASIDNDFCWLLAGGHYLYAEESYFESISKKFVVQGIITKQLLEGRALQAYRIETTLTKGGMLTLKNLPFQKGESVEIIILRQSIPLSRKDEYPLRGTLLNYINPTEPVAQEDWEALPWLSWTPISGSGG